jgi:hypothetical protein
VYEYNLSAGKNVYKYIFNAGVEAWRCGFLKIKNAGIVAIKFFPGATFKLFC